MNEQQQRLVGLANSLKENIVGLSDVLKTTIEQNINHQDPNHAKLFREAYEKNNVTAKLDELRDHLTGMNKKRKTDL